MACENSLNLSTTAWIIKTITLDFKIMRIRDVNKVYSANVRLFYTFAKTQRKFSAKKFILLLQREHIANFMIATRFFA